LIRGPEAGLFILVLTKGLDKSSWMIYNENIKVELLITFIKLMKPKKENKKTVRVSEAQYQIMRRDSRAKKEIKGLALMLHDKVKNWK